MTKRVLLALVIATSLMAQTPQNVVIQNGLNGHVVLDTYLSNYADLGYANDGDKATNHSGSDIVKVKNCPS